MTVTRGLNFGCTSVDVELEAEWQIMIQDIDLRMIMFTTVANDCMEGIILQYAHRLFAIYLQQQQKINFRDIAITGCLGILCVALELL